MARNIVEDDKLEFYRSVLGNREFSRTVTLFGAKKVTFTTLSLYLEKTLNTLLAGIDNTARQRPAGPDTEQERQYARDLVTLFFFMHGDKVPARDVSLSNVMAQARSLYETPERTSSWWQALLTAQAAFVDDVDELRTNAPDMSFWAAASKG